MSTRNLAPSAAPAVFPWRRVTLAVLLAAGIVAAASLAGPIWLVRVGSVVGLAAGVVAAVLAVRSFRRLEERHREATGDQLITLERAHGDRLREHRAHDAEVAETMRGHLRRQDADNVRLRAHLTRSSEIIEQQRASLEALHAERTELRGDLAAKDAELAAKDEEIGGLRRTLTVREEELAALLGDADAAEVYAMPRRVRTAERAADPEAPELVDLATLQTATPPARPEAADVRRQA